MKIGEIAKVAGVTTSRIRFYEKRGIISPALRGPNGYRDYPENLIAILHFIEQAQGLGFTLKEIASIEVADAGHPISCDEAIRLLSDKLKSVETLITEAEERKLRIKTLIAEFKQRQE